MRFRSPRIANSGFTLIEVMVAAAVFGLFATALVTTWAALGAAAMNTTAYAQRQNDQMRVFDYVKRDIRRATSVGIYSGGVLVTGTNWGSTLQLTIPKYYTDSRAEDNAIGSSTATTPTVTSGNVAYGTPMTVQYYVSNGAVIRNESGSTRQLADAVGAFTLSFQTDVSGLIRCRVLFSQRMRSGNNRALTRQVDVLCGQRSQL